MHGARKLLNSVACGLVSIGLLALLSIVQMLAALQAPLHKAMASRTSWKLTQVCIGPSMGVAMNTVMCPMTRTSQKSLSKFRVLQSPDPDV